MARPKGYPKSGGRVAGTPNKKTATAKENLGEVFTMLGDVKGLHLWALENQSEFYKMWAQKIIPNAPTDVNVGGQPDNPLTTVSKVVLMAMNDDSNNRASE